MSSTKIRPIEWREGRVRLLDQTRLPGEVVYLDITDYRDMAQAIKTLQVRGAPALGVAGAYGLVLAAQAITAGDCSAFLASVKKAAVELRATRPTAVNLGWALDRLLRVADQGAREAVGAIHELPLRLLNEAHRIAQEDEAGNLAIGRHGAELVPQGASVLTHCNAGALATSAYGTALGVVRAAWEQGRIRRVFNTETRPLLQGARLTAWELLQDGIQTTLITDSMAGYFIHRGEIDCVVVGADRIAANGDVANKIGTYTIAVLAAEHGIPFYVAAPTSTIDLSVPNGEAIPIEERRPEEVTHIQGVATAPAGVWVANPAFDITPHQYVTAIITEKGVVREPYQERLRRLVGEVQAAG
ncbi:MAG: S-methyl-5-thioribose-1-phosphate isomerase [Chloroflexi bacterium]|nr:S-methyl-5-thioribose-1-phosphate isomerase [Chloroflexota bacterium]